MLTPRQYQIEAVKSIYEYFKVKNGNPIVAIPTAGGKSLIIAMFLQSVLFQWPMQRIMVLTHVKKLIEQNYKKLIGQWPLAPAGIYSAGLNKRDTLHSIIFAGIASVVNRAAEFGKIDLIIIDEAHLVSPHDSTMYQKFIGALQAKNPFLKVIGFTATPYRMGQGKLTDAVTDKHGNEIPALFTDICYDITGLGAFNKLIAEGYLSRLIPRATETQLDVSGVHIRGGEFIAGELEAAVNKQEVTEAAIKETIELAGDRKHWIVFSSGVEHTDDIVNTLDEMGVNAIGVHSKHTKQHNDEAMLAFERGEVTAIVSNNMLTTGVDFPDADLLLILRPTTSTGLWVQICGRGCRVASGKRNCLVLDFAANTKRLGPINDPITPRKKGSGTGDAPVKECPQCHQYVPASVRFCPAIIEEPNQAAHTCGYKFEFETKLKAHAGTDEIVKGDLPIIEVFKVDHVTYAEYQKIGRPPSIRVTYYCGYKTFYEYVCLEHGGYAARKALQWWKTHARVLPDTGLPHTTAEGIERIGELATPTHLRVWVNKQYPEILATCFDGTAFGTQLPGDDAAPTSAGGPEPEFDTTPTLSAKEHVAAILKSLAKPDAVGQTAREIADYDDSDVKSAPDGALDITDDDIPF